MEDSCNPVSLDVPMSSQELEATQLEPRDGPSVAEMPCVPLSSPGVFATQVDTHSTVEK